LSRGTATVFLKETICIFVFDYSGINMRSSIFVLLFFGFHFSIGQPSAKLLFTPKTSNELANVPGTRVKLKLGDGFKISRSFNGVQKGNAVVEFFDVPGANYSTMLSDMTPEKLTAQGFLFVGKENIRINGVDATLIFLHRGEVEKTISLIFGNTSFTVIAVASFPRANEVIEQQIIDMLMSISYGDDKTIDALAHAAFKLDDKRSDFHYKKYAANTFYYTEGESPVIRESDSYLAVTQMVWDYSTSPAMIAELMLREMSRHGVASTVVKKRSTRNVNGYRAFESEIQAKRNGLPCTIYQMVLVHNDKAVVIHGINNGKTKKATDSFRKLARTVQLR
jgi:hypothetical protein